MNSSVSQEIFRRKDHHKPVLSIAKNPPEETSINEEKGCDFHQCETPIIKLIGSADLIKKHQYSQKTKYLTAAFSSLTKIDETKIKMRNEIMVLKQGFLLLENLRRNKFKIVLSSVLVIVILYITFFELGGATEQYLSEKYRSESRIVEPYFDINNNFDYIVVSYIYSDFTKRFSERLVEVSNLKDELENNISEAPNFDGADYFDYDELESVLNEANTSSYKFYKNYGDYWEPIKYRSEILRLGMQYYYKTKQVNGFKRYYRKYSDFSSQVITNNPNVTADPLWNEWSDSVKKMYGRIAKKKSNDDPEAIFSLGDTGSVSVD